MDDAVSIPPDMQKPQYASLEDAWKDAKARKSHAEHRVRPHRVEMLAKGIDLTWGDRDKEYGDPLINGACAAELKAVLRKYAAMSPRQIGLAELEFLEMNLTKVARIITGPQVKEDSYIDGGVYMCMAGEAAIRSAE